MTDASEFNPPSIDPAQRATIFGTVQFIVDKMVMQEMNKLMPCKVVAVNRTTNRVSVQILVSMVTTAGKNIVRAQIGSVPIYSPSAGGFVINFPVQPDDLGWIKATDADISLFLQNLKQSPPNTNILHKFDSAVFFPDNMNKGVTIAGEDANNLVIQNYASTVRIAVWGDKVKITAPELHVVCPQTTIDATDVTVNTTTAEINASDTTTVTSPNVDVVSTNVSVSATDVSVVTETAEVVATGAVSVTSSSTIDLTASTSINLTAPITYISGALAAGSGSGDAAVFSGPISTTQTVTAGINVVGGGKSLISHEHSGVEPGGGNTGPPI